MGQIKGYRSTVEVEVFGPADLSAAMFTAQIRATAKSTDLLGELTTASGISVTSEVSADPDYDFRSLITMTFPESMTGGWPDKVVTDFARTDPTPDQYLGFKLEMDWETPVTRL
jgi:hypothetical protein